eukprot:g3305.t1
MTPSTFANKIFQPPQLFSLFHDDGPGFIVIDDFLGKDNAMDVLSELKHLDSKGNLKPAGMGRGEQKWTDPTIRGDRFMWVPGGVACEGAPVALSRLFDSVHFIRDEFKSVVPSLQLSERSSVQLSCYPGSPTTPRNYRRHRDAYVGSAEQRKLTCLYYTCEDWKESHGGQLRLYLPHCPTFSSKGFHDVSPKLDRLLSFRSDVVDHEVLDTYCYRRGVERVLRTQRHSSSYSIGVYPGDGIGVDVSDATFRVLDKMGEKYGFQLEQTWYPWGCDYFDKTGKAAPDDMTDTLQSHDAIFLGAVGYPERLPDHITLEPLIRMRQAFDQFACVRPARTFAGVKSPLAGEPHIDMVVVRENSEGEYIDCGGRLQVGLPSEVAIQSAVHTRRGVERVLRYGFELAARPDRRQKLTMVTKSNAQRYSMTLWDEVLDEISPEYKDIEVEKQHVDACAMNFIRQPESFDVVVASNLFGDILTDLSGVVTGSLGLNPSANIDPSRKFPSLFEPVHGSAPDITGKGIANPTGALLSSAMMLDWLGESVAANSIRDAVSAVLLRGATPDVGGTLSTHEFTNAIIENLELK